MRSAGESTYKKLLELNGSVPVGVHECKHLSLRRSVHGWERALEFRKVHQAISAPVCQEVLQILPSLRKPTGRTK